MSSDASSGRSPRLVERRISRSAVWGLLATCLMGLGVVFFVTGFPLVADYSRVEGFGIAPDVLHERATAWEAVHGDPYRPITEIMAEHGHPEMAGGLSPRTPAALLMQLPLIGVPVAILMPVVTVAICVLVIAMLAMAGRISGAGWTSVVWVGPLLFVSHAVVTNISYGSLSVATTVALILMAWAFQDKNWAGIPLGLAAAMRLWPGLIIIGFWISGRRKAAYVALGVFLGVNAIGLLLPGVTLEGSLDALTQGGRDWINHNQNASLANVLTRFDVPLVVTTVLASTVGVILAIRNPSQAVPICIVSALIASPLSWPAYMLAALPILLSWWRAGGRLPVAVLSAPLVLWLGTPTDWKGRIGFVVLAFLLWFSAFGMGRSEPREIGKESPSVVYHGSSSVAQYSRR